MKLNILLLTFFVPQICLAQETFQYNLQTKASDYARGAFGPSGSFEQVPQLDVGNFSADIHTDLDCGNIDIKANFTGEFKRLQEQIKQLIPNENNIGDYIAKSAMIGTCYAFPTVCAELRHNFLSLQGNLNLRAKACEAIDKFIDSQADKGAKQLKAEAQYDCASKLIHGPQKMDPSAAMEACSNTTGLGIRDFSNAMDKTFKTGPQKVLSAILGFAQDQQSYPFLSTLVGEIEVQGDGYWKPVFASGMRRPNDVAESFLSHGESLVCSQLLEIMGNTFSAGGDLAKATVASVIKKRLTKEDLSNLSDLGPEDQKLACAALGRAVGQVGAEKLIAKQEATLASGLLNSAIPNSLRDEYRGRGQTAFAAVRKTIESEQIPSIDFVRQAVADLARATRQRNRLLASQISQGRIANERAKTESKSDCNNTLNCEGR